jgi:hypothetical protein
MINLIAFILIFSAISLFAQSQQSSDQALQPHFAFSPGLRIWGADIGISYELPLLGDSVFTRLLGSLGGGYETMAFYRNPDGTFYAGTEPGTNPAIAPFYNRVDFHWSIGAVQGLFRLPDAASNTVEAFLAYRGRYDADLPPADISEDLLAQSGRADSASIFQNSILFGLSFDTVTEIDFHDLYTGLRTEISAEYFPPFAILAGSGSSMGALRFNLTARGYLPIFDLNPVHTQNTLSFYLADFFSIDWAVPVAGGETTIPFNVLQSFGGTQPMTGLGGMVRGTEYGNYDTPFKAVNCLDLRFNLPSLFVPALIPTFLVFLDAGYYGPSPEGGDGFLFSTGAGLYVDFFGIATVGISTHLLLNHLRIGQSDGWEPITVDFGLHF